MPNWCNNNIKIEGPTDKIRTLWQRSNVSNEDCGLLNQMRPMPEALKQTTSPTPADSEQPVVDGHDNWYDWRVANWSTKWEIDTEGLEYTENTDGTATISGWFDSAWAPPTEACNFYSQQNPDVTITLDYHEPGMCFVGQAYYEDGDCIQDDCIDYSDCDHKTVRDHIGADYDDNWNISEQMAEWADEEDDHVEA